MGISIKADIMGAIMQPIAPTPTTIAPTVQPDVEQFMDNVIGGVNHDQTFSL